MFGNQNGLLELSSVDDRICWICLSNEVDFGSDNIWRKPCQCRGALKWVHQICLQRWIDEQQRSRDDTEPILCSICKTQYQITYPELGILYNILQSVDRFTRSMSYMLTGGLLFGAFYWSSVTYGAITLMQIYGHSKGLQTMQHTDPPLLIFALPLIPVCLILAKTIPWENGLLLLWRHHISRLFLFQLIRRKEHPSWQVDTSVTDMPLRLSNIPRLICSALMLPSISTLVGQTLFKYVHSDIRRTVYGALTYLSLEGALNIYYRESQYSRMCYRQIKDYEN